VKAGRAELVFEKPILSDAAIKGLIDNWIVPALVKLYMRDMMTDAAKSKAEFVEPKLLLRTDKLPEGAEWQYDQKLDGYRAIAFKSDGKLHLRSRNEKDLQPQIPRNREGSRSDAGRDCNRRRDRRHGSMVTSCLCAAAVAGTVPLLVLVF
jgi:hypothetical protein